MHALAISETSPAGRARDGLGRSRILLIEDSCAMRNALSDAIRAQGFDISATDDEEEVLAELTNWQPDLILLDLSVHEGRGLSICRRIREKSAPAVVVIASPGEEARVLLALELGATDYIIRPLDFEALMARVRTALTRSGPSGDLRDTTLEVGPLLLHLARREVIVRGQLLHFPKLEYDLLLALVLQPGHIRTRTELLERVWGRRLGDSKTLDAHLVRLRRKIEHDSERRRHIITVRGVGYYFDPQGRLEGTEQSPPTEG